MNGAVRRLGPAVRRPGAGLTPPRLSTTSGTSALGSGVRASWRRSCRVVVLPDARRVPRAAAAGHPKPALGGLAVGLLALQLPQVLGGGYGWIQQAIDGRLALELMLVLVVRQDGGLRPDRVVGRIGRRVRAEAVRRRDARRRARARVFHQPAAAFVVVGMAAVFGGAARVPIATLLMVTEMTGGYQLLVPAALAVMFSAFVESLISGRLKLKYFSLYEAQVPSRADSPVHTGEYLNVALRLLEQHAVHMPESVGPVSLRDLLAAGLPVTLPDGKQFIFGAVPVGSPLGGCTLDRAFDDVPDCSVVAAFREGHTLLAHPGMSLRSGDRLLVLVPAEGRDRIRDRLTPPVPV